MALMNAYWYDMSEEYRVRACESIISVFNENRIRNNPYAIPPQAVANIIYSLGYILKYYLYYIHYVSIFNRD